MAYKIDKIDKAILYEIDKNSRASYGEIAKRIKSKKNVVAYRFNQLVENKVIEKCATLFALGMVNLFNYKIYFQFQGLSKQDEEKMINDLVAEKKIIWVAKCEGRWDLMISHHTSFITEFAQIKNRIFEKYGKYVNDYSVVINEEAFLYNRDYLISSKEDDRRSSRKHKIHIGKLERLDLNEKDKRLVLLISNNSRFKVLELAKRLDYDVKTVQSRIRRFEKIGFIQGYTTVLNMDEIRYKFLKLFIYLKDYNHREYNALIEFCKCKPNLLYLMKTMGSWEIELEIEAEDMEYMHNLTKELRNTFPKIIKKIESVIISQVYKLNFFPDEF